MDMLFGLLGLLVMLLLLGSAALVVYLVVRRFWPQSAETGMEALSSVSGATCDPFLIR